MIHLLRTIQVNDFNLNNNFNRLVRIEKWRVEQFIEIDIIEILLKNEYLYHKSFSMLKCECYHIKTCMSFNMDEITNKVQKYLLVTDFNEVKF